MLTTNNNDPTSGYEELTYVHALENAEYYNTRVFRNISEQITQAFASVITKGVSPQIAVDSFSDAFQSSIDKYYDR